MPARWYACWTCFAIWVSPSMLLRLAAAQPQESELMARR